MRPKKSESVFFPLIIVVAAITRAYAAEFGFTKEDFDRILEAEKRQREQIESDLKALFDEIPPDADDDDKKGA